MPAPTKTTTQLADPRDRTAVLLTISTLQGDGLSTEEIARRLGISPRTLYRLLAKVRQERETRPRG